MKISSRLVSLRSYAGISRYQLAKMTGIAATQLAQYENGKTVPSIDSLSKILDALGCTLSEFFNDGSDVLYLSEREISLIQQYRTLPDEQRGLVEQIAAAFLKANRT